MMIGALGCSVMAGCSDDDSDGSFGPVSSKVELTLGGYPNSAGGTVIPVWKNGDRGAFYSLGPGKSEAAYAEPILAGASTEPFLFTFNGWRNTPSDVVGVYPADAQVECIDSKIIYNVPSTQNGTPDAVLVGWAHGIVNSYEGISMTLKPLYATLVVPVERGNYSVNTVSVKANGGENLAGQIAYDPVNNTGEATEPTAKVSFASGLDCSGQSQNVVVMLAPVKLSAGYTIDIDLSDGQKLSVVNGDETVLMPGERYKSTDVKSEASTHLAFCGSDMIYMIDPALITNSYKDAVIWQWDAKTLAPVLGIKESRCNHIDDCKPVEAGKRMLVTSSYNWAALLDVETKQPLFYTTQSTNAHSAELLPGGKVAVACSTGGDAVQIYDITKPNQVVFSASLPSAHGVVWMESTQRLYAIGGKTMNVYKLVDWETATPKIELERSIETKKSGLHDLTKVDDNTLCVSGQSSYLFNINDESWTQLSLLAGATALKSVNYNAETREMWYTDATVPEGSQTWSTHTLHYATDPFGSTDASTVRCEDIDIYKVRVFSW